jgi:N-acetylneuraminate synthase
LSKRTLIIAEAGVNHNGSLDMALKLVDVAANAGADVVKFQTFNADQLATPKADKAEYQVSNTKDEGSQLEMLRGLELSAADHHALVTRCKVRDIRFMSTGFDSQSLAFLALLDMPAIKIPSGDITCGPLLLQAARLRRPLIISTGMSTLADIEQALGVIAFGLTTNREPIGDTDFEAAYCSTDGQQALRQYVTLLHCVTQYPAPPEAVNLRAMDTMASAFGLPIGYSDHAAGIDIAVAAVARGATVLEKHFTLDRSLPGPDHAASIEPQELTKLVMAVRNIESALGSPLKMPAPQEMANLAIARRSVVAACAIQFGETFTSETLTYKRPGCGISPMEYWSLVGSKARRDYSVDELIEP